MTADDKWGHVYLTLDGKLHDFHGMSDPAPPKNWMVHYYYRENDGPTYMRKGPQRRLCLEFNGRFSLDEASSVMNKYGHRIKDSTIRDNLYDLVEDREFSRELAESK